MFSSEKVCLSAASATFCQENLGAFKLRDIILPPCKKKSFNDFKLDLDVSWDIINSLLEVIGKLVHNRELLLCEQDIFDALAANKLPEFLTKLIMPFKDKDSLVIIPEEKDAGIEVIEEEDDWLHFEFKSKIDMQILENLRKILDEMYIMDSMKLLS